MSNLIREPLVTADHEVRMMRSRASSLVEQARMLPEPLATTYRRRARELALEANLLEHETAAR